MSILDAQERPEPPDHANEVDTLVGFLDYQRATFAWKCRDLDSAGLNASVAPTSMTLGGMMKHLALVEDGWFSRTLFNRERSEPWSDIDWSAEPDWEWHSAAHNTPQELWALWNKFVEQSRRNVSAALQTSDLGQRAQRGDPERAPSLRWILCHMIEEYARHNGHADLLRESIDGATGE